MVRLGSRTSRPHQLLKENAIKFTLPPVLRPIDADPNVPDTNLEPRVKVPHLSYSQLSTYMACSEKYYFSYILKMPRKPSLKMSIGTGGHAALEANTKFKIRTGHDMPLDQILDAASAHIDNAIYEVDNATDAAKGEAKDRAIASIRVFRNRDAAALKPIGAEVEFNIDINTDKNVEPIRIINGKIDLIRTDQGIKVEDYKFVGRARTQLEVDLSPQLTLYASVLHQLTGQYAASVGYRQFLPGGKTKPPDAIPVVRDPALMTPERQAQQFVRLQNQFRQVQQSIDAGIHYPADNPKVCSWCDYLTVCNAAAVTPEQAVKIRGDEE